MTLNLEDIYAEVYWRVLEFGSQMRKRDGVRLARRVDMIMREKQLSLLSTVAGKRKRI